MEKVVTTASEHRRRSRAAGNRRQHRAVQRRIAQVRLLAEQVTRLPEQRRRRVEDGSDDPVVEIVRRAGRVAADEIPVSGLFALDRISYSIYCRK
jgi:hypothetical protein